MLRNLALLGLLGLAVAGCASPGEKKAEQARTPTELYKLQADTRQDQVLLAVHSEGLSPAQQDALRELVQRWRDGGSGAIQIGAPHGASDAGAVYRTTQAVRDRLIGLGVPAAAISQHAYESGTDAKAPLTIAFTRYEAVTTACGRSWDNLTSTESNTVQSNFGCAVTANMAAQIADPADIAGPRASEPADAGRRVTVIENYRKGELTAATADDKSSGTVSKAVGQ